MSSSATSSTRLPASSHPTEEHPGLSFESLGVLASLLALAAVAFVLIVGLRGRRLPESRAVGEGRYSQALSEADLSEDDLDRLRSLGYLDDTEHSAKGSSP